MHKMLFALKSANYPAAAEAEQRTVSQFAQKVRSLLRGGGSGLSPLLKLRLATLPTTVSPRRRDASLASPARPLPAHSVFRSPLSLSLAHQPFITSAMAVALCAVHVCASERVRGGARESPPTATLRLWNARVFCAFRKATAAEPRVPSHPHLGCADRGVACHPKAGGGGRWPQPFDPLLQPRFRRTTLPDLTFGWRPTMKL